MSLRKPSQINGELVDHERNEDGVVRRKRKEKPPMTEGWLEIWRKWPKTTFCIVVNEFCERFSFYGMKTVLQIYLINVLRFSNDTSAVFFNTFTALCYLTPVLGSIIADGYIGKFKTIFFVSIVYAAGQIILALASIQGAGSNLHPYLDLFGLFVIALGTGGIKPCVSPFGGDQFEPHESKMISLFFSAFYFSINAGSLISTFASPIMRSTPCMGKDSCYPMAFGFPAILMIIATIAFTLGSFWYKKPMPKSNVFKDVGAVFKRAFKNRSGKRDHWLDHALNGHDCQQNPKCLKLKRKRHDPNACAEAQFIADIKSLQKLLVMFAPMVVFWSLYDQQGSFFTIQAIQMDCRLWGNAVLLPDQMQVVNPVLILVMIFIFESIVYPIVGKFVKITALRKMVAGGFFAALAFAITAFVQFKVNETLPILPSGGHAYVSVMNTMDNCNITATATGYTPASVLVPSKTSLQNRHKDINLFHVKKDASVEFQFNYTGVCKTEVLPEKASFDITDSKHQIFFIHVSTLGMFLAPSELDKPTEANGEFSMGITIAFTDKTFDQNLALCRGSKDSDTCNPSQKKDFYFFERDYVGDFGKTSDFVGNFDYKRKGGSAGVQAAVFKAKDIRPGSWRLFYMQGNSDGPTDGKFKYAQVSFQREEEGGVYMMSLTGSSAEMPERVDFRAVADNGLSILWQLPQLIVITIAEILFSITGNEFSYTQAAPSMKSIAGAFWLLTNFFGDMLIVVLTLIHFTDNLAIMFLTYAILMVVVMIVVTLMSIFYFEYTNYTGDDAQDDSDSEDEEECEDNGSYVNKSLDKQQILKEEMAWNTRL